MEEKKYEFKCGIKATQTPMSLGKSKKLMALMLKETGKSGPMDEEQFAAVLLSGDTLIDKMLDLMLEVTYKPKDVTWDDVFIDELLEVKDDFFTLSPKLAEKFVRGKSAADLPAAHARMM